MLYFGAFLYYVCTAIIGTLQYQTLSHKVNLKFYLFLVNLKKERMPHYWDHIQFLIYCLIALSIGFIHESLIAQSVLIVFSLLLTLVLLLVFKPFIEIQQLWVEIATFCLFLFSYVFLFILSINEDKGCT